MILVDRIAVGLAALSLLLAAILYECGMLEHHVASVPGALTGSTQILPNALPPPDDQSDLDAAFPDDPKSQPPASAHYLSDKQFLSDQQVGIVPNTPATADDIWYVAWKIISSFVFPLWLFLRVLDFVFSGRIRLERHY